MAKYLTKNEVLEDQSDKQFIRSEQDNEKDRIFPQLLAGIAANVTAIITGTVIAWTSPSLPILEGPDSPIPITKVQNSWISSLMPLAATFGPFAAGYLADRFGRKKSLLFSAGPALISWICLAFGRSVAIIYVARFIAGFTVGWIFTVLPMYCAEISNKSVRGAISSLMQMFIVIGLLFDYCIGPYIPYAWLSVAAAFVPLIFVVVFVWMPESPYYLLKKNDRGNAEKALQWLRGKSAEGVFNELLDIQANVDQAKSETGTFKDLFATKGTIKALIISLGLVAFQQLSGINVVLFNTQSIFEKAGGSLKSEISAIITGLIMLFASAVTPLVVDKVGRKILLLISASGMAIAQVSVKLSKNTVQRILGILGLCFFLEKKGTDMSSFNYLSILSVIFYIIIYCLGFGPLPWTVMGEMFPSNIKTLASTLTASFCWILGFFVTRFFNDIVEKFGNDYSFWLFSVFCLVAIPFVQFLLVETKGKTFTEIQDMLNINQS